MITPKIKALFQFIEYLHSNIENFNQHIDLINELWLLDQERKVLRPEKNYKDKLQYDKLQAEIEIKFDELQEKTANPIKAKVIELNLGNVDNNELFFNMDIGNDIDQLKKNFSNNDLLEIFKHKNKYIEFRKNDYSYFLSLYFFFLKLDRTTKALFDFFKEPTAPNEYEGFETKVIQVNNAKEAFDLMQKGELCVFNINPLNPSVIQKQTDFEPGKPQQESSETETGQTETLSDLITNKNRVEIIKSVKNQYRNIKGKRLKLLLMAFQDLDLLPKERISFKFHDCCKNEFDWDIASYNAMNGYNYNEITDKIELNKMKEYLESLIKPK